MSMAVDMPGRESRRSRTQQSASFTAVHLPIVDARHPHATRFRTVKHPTPTRTGLTNLKSEPNCKVQRRPTVRSPLRSCVSMELGAAGSPCRRRRRGTSRRRHQSARGAAVPVLEGSGDDVPRVLGRRARGRAPPCFKDQRCGGPGPAASAMALVASS